MTSYTNVFGGDTVPPSGMGFRLITLAANLNLNWPNNYEGPDFITDINEVTASVAGWQINLPSASESSAGTDLIFRNVGAYPFQINSYNGVPVSTVAAGEVKYLYLVDNTSDAGTWRTFTYGTGTSQADANLLRGNGLQVLGSTLATAFPVTITTIDQSPTVGDRATIYAFNGGSATVSLPSVLTVGNGYFVGVRNAGTGTILLSPTSPDIIDNISSINMNPGESCFVYCSGSTWFTVGYSRSTQFNFTKLVKDISAGGALTLTANEASNKLIQFSGTPASNVTLTVPSIVNVYYIQCVYTGAPTLLIKTASGTGVTVTNNTTAILFCDGSNIVSIAGVISGGGGGGGGGGGVINYGDGTAANPAITFSSDTHTGLYLVSSGTLGISSGGVEQIRVGTALVGMGQSLGIGTLTPTTKLDVRGASKFNGNGATDLAGGFAGVMAQLGAASGTNTRELVDAYGAQPFVTMRSSNGTLTSPSVTLNNNNLGSLTFAGRKSTTWSGDTGFVIGRAAEDWTDTANGTKLLFAVTPNGSTASTVKMILDQNGFLAVNQNTAPVQALTVTGSGSFTGRVVANACIGSSTDGSYPLQSENNTPSDAAAIQFRYTNGSSVTNDVCYLNASDTIPFRLQGISPTYTTLFQTDPSGNCSAPAFNATSDDRLKTDWADVGSDFIEKLAQVRHGTFTRIDTLQRQVGVSAQSLQPVLPEAVVEYDAEHGYLSVSYGNAALVASIELAKRLLALEARLSDHGI